MAKRSSSASISGSDVTPNRPICSCAILMRASVRIDQAKGRTAVAASHSAQNQRKCDKGRTPPSPRTTAAVGIAQTAAKTGEMEGPVRTLSPVAILNAEAPAMPSSNNPGAVFDSTRAGETSATPATRVRIIVTEVSNTIHLRSVVPIKSSEVPAPIHARTSGKLTPTATGAVQGPTRGPHLGTARMARRIPAEHRSRIRPSVKPNGPPRRKAAGSTRSGIVRRPSRGSSAAAPPRAAPE